MAYPVVPLDPAVEEEAFYALVNVLRNDKDLKKVVKTWVYLNGDESSLNPTDTRQMPWVRILPGPSELRIQEAAAWGMNLHLYVAIATAGLDARSQFRLWAAVRKALNRDAPFRDVDVAQYLRESGIDNYRISNPGFGPFRVPMPDRESTETDLIVAARIVLDLTIPFTS